MGFQSKADTPFNSFSMGLIQLIGFSNPALTRIGSIDS